MWKTIEGFENYEVSDNGEVRNKKTGRVLKNSAAPIGYLRVNLRANNQSYTRYVHRLVALNFLEGEGEVNHIDGNKSNNNVKNLEWVSHKENIEHAEKTGLRDGRKKKILVEYLDGTTLTFGSRKECADYYNVDPTTIRDYINSKLTASRAVQANFKIL
jgi:hypothetical protein